MENWFWKLEVHGANNSSIKTTGNHSTTTDMGCG